MIIAISLGFILAILTPILFKYQKKIAGLILSLLPLGLFLYFLSYANSVLDGNKIVEVYKWFPSLGINLSFLLDGLSLIFSLIITGIGFAVFLYASYYMKDNKYISRFYIYILVFMTAMLGVVISNNIISLFVFWEITSISSYLLIGFNHDTEKSRYSALQALLVTGGGGLAMLGGFILIMIITGESEISQIFAKSDLILQSSLLTPIVILILLGAFTKSAQFPFHFWLPNAMEAPTPVSAYLHSATMVKAGIFLIARFSPLFNGVELWNWLLIIAGSTTMFMGAAISIKQTDLKRILAYSTVSVLGILTFLLGIGTEIAINAMILYLIAHSIYKGALFLIAGIVDHSAGTRDIREVGGLKSFMPLIAYSGLFSALSMLGMFPFLGFIGKETLYSAVLQFGYFNYFLISITVITGILLLITSVMAGVKPFFGKLKHQNEHPHKVSWQMATGPVFLAIMGLLFGLFGNSLLNSTVNIASGNILSGISNFEIHLWHGFNTVFMLSLLTIAIGAILYYYFDYYIDLIRRFNAINLLKPSVLYDKLIELLVFTARFITKFLQNGYLSNYILMIILTTLFLTILSFSKFSIIQNIAFNLDYEIYELIIVIIAIVSSIALIMSPGRLAAVALTGVTGFSVAIIYIFYSAPDLALTQFAVETLTVIIFVLVIYKLPKFVSFSRRLIRWRDFAVASLFGAMMSYIVLMSYSVHFTDDFKRFFSENSYTVAKGKNIVNVILVDFRAMDTLGEIIVLSVAAIGIYLLINIKPEDKEKKI